MLYYTYESIKYSPYTSIITAPNNRKHKLQFWKITYAIRGEAEIIVNGEKKPFRNDTVFFIKPTDILQNINYKPEKEYRHRDIYISDEKLQAICANLPVNPYKKLLKKNIYFSVSKLQTENLEYFLNFFPTNSEKTTPFLDSIHQTVIINCLTMFLQSILSRPQAPAWLQKVANRTKLDEYLQNNVNYFLQGIPYSKRHICREFQKYYNVSPTEYLTKAKIVQSTNYLMDKNLLISDIAQHLGFCTQSGFIKAFKTYFSMSPNAWRKKYLTDKNYSPTTEHGPSQEI